MTFSHLSQHPIITVEHSHQYSNSYIEYLNAAGFAKKNYAPGDFIHLCVYTPPLQGPSILTFNIGSVDSFERNLEQAQSDLDIDPADRLPVTYVAEAEWLREVLKLAPTLLILGTIIFFSRRMAGGGSGRGVSGALSVWVYMYWVYVYKIMNISCWEN